MRQRKLGATDTEVSAVGLGCMGMSWGYAESTRDDTVSISVLRGALDRGVSFVDTSDVYGDGHNEVLVGEGIRGRRSEVVLATKCGLVVDDLASRVMHRDGSPRHLRTAIEASLRRLRVDAVDLYYLHRVDPQVPLEDSWGALAEFVAEGKVARLGLSEVTPEQASLAHRIHPVTAVQSELSLWTRDALAPGADMVAWCADNGAAFVPYSPLGRGFLTGTVSGPADFEESDFRASSPRFAAGAIEPNLRIVEVARRIANRRHVTPAQVAIAWTLGQGEHVVPIPGTKKESYLAENIAAADIVLTEQDMDELDRAPAAVGARY
ncbi:aldo/keto reductase [Pseudonocardia spinosispora]|uniref:aldo/keto reductase n=1 Tax=Pseudonocardia spinosispora TaxID=103441 RepID=UPI000411ED18|nr:aldo/keto reductase [Pseudonocardia spinosispora]